MRTKLQWIDLAMCTAWILGAIAGSGSAFILFAIALFMRLVVSFSLYRKEKRSWIPLLAFATSLGLFVSFGTGGGIGGICKYSCILMGINYHPHGNIILYSVVGALFCWLILAPFVYYLTMLLRHRLIKTEMTKKDLLGAVMWNDRRARYYSAFLAIMLLGVYTGMSMFYGLCLTMCLTLTPLTYWLICRYYRVKSKNIGVMVIALLVFWYAQINGELIRISMLAASFCMIAYVCSHIYKETRQVLLTVICIVYLAVMLPSFTIGYNQYACIEYSRSNFVTLPSYRGIFVIEDTAENRHFGLRDRYGLLVKPEYETIRIGDPRERYFLEYCRLEKDGFTQVYNIWNNEILPTERNAELQADLCNIIDAYYTPRNSTVENDYGNSGEIKVTDLSTNKVVGHANIVMFGNPFFEYEGESLLPKDSIEIVTNAYLYNDSVWIQEAEDYGFHKNILTYSENIPNDSCPKYNVYVRLARGFHPTEKDIQSIMTKVKRLKFFNKSSKR